MVGNMEMALEILRVFSGFFIYVGLCRDCVLRYARWVVCMLYSDTSVGWVVFLNVFRVEA